eukprot:scaffold4511_cov171-Amphora_coffeaeformis.AAC.23
MIVPGMGNFWNGTDRDINLRGINQDDTAVGTRSIRRLTQQLRQASRSRNHGLGETFFAATWTWASGSTAVAFGGASFHVGTIHRDQTHTHK